MMNQIWKELVVNCPIHGRSITRTPIYQPTLTFNTNYYIQRNQTITALLKPSLYKPNTIRIIFIIKVIQVEDRIQLLK